MRYGYQDKLLRINLSTGSVATEPLSDEMVDKFIGGRGFVAKLLFRRTAARASMPMTRRTCSSPPPARCPGHFLVPASGKTHFGAKSPATGGYADSNMGGHFGPALKYAGYDVLVAHRKVRRQPSYLFIEDDQVEIRPADAYWGQGALTAEKNLKDGSGRGFSDA
jgi:aldehyde:ferredoxin oxidoreductase